MIFIKKRNVIFLFLKVYGKSLYDGKQLNLHNLFVIFNFFLDQRISPTITTGLEDFSFLREQLDASSEDMDVMRKRLDKEAEKCADITNQVQDLVLEAVPMALPKESLMYNSILCDSPVIPIKIHADIEQKHLHQVQLTPEGWTLH